MCPLLEFPIKLHIDVDGLIPFSHVMRNVDYLSINLDGIIIDTEFSKITE